MHAGLDKKYIQGHLLAFSAAAPIVAIPTYFILHAVRNHTKEDRYILQCLSVLFYLVDVVSADGPVVSEPAQSNRCGDALFSWDFPLRGHGSRSSWDQQPQEPSALWPPATGEHRSPDPPAATHGAPGEPHSGPRCGASHGVGSRAARWLRSAHGDRIVKWKRAHCHHTWKDNSEQPFKCALYCVNYLYAQWLDDKSLSWCVLNTVWILALCTYKQLFPQV